MSQDTVEQDALEGKDRDQLIQIAKAIGVKSATRLRKAELVDAIIRSGQAGPGEAPAAPAGAEPSARRPGPDDGNRRDASRISNAATPKRIRSARASEADPIALLAAEEAEISTAADPASSNELPIARGRRPVSAPEESAGTNGRTGGARPSTFSGRSQSAPTAPASISVPTSPAVGGAASVADAAGDPAGDGEDSESGWRDDDAPGNRKRRRRRGRDRERPGERAPESRDSEYGGDLIEIEGMLDLRDEGYGFLRSSGYLAGRNDAYVSASLVRRYSLRRGDHVRGATRPPTSTEKYPALGRIDEVSGMSPDDARNRPRFEDLTPLFPDEQLRLERRDKPEALTGRIIDLIAPIGKGQRGLIVSPPKAGKTTIIKEIVAAIEHNEPDCHVIVLQVDERPEEVTDMRRHVKRAEVVASTFDRPSDEHCHVAELAIERAKRLVEQGLDVVVVLDGITRLARAYNLAAPPSGRIMTGGIDAAALYPPKRFFGAARNVEEGGSLTILATALVETNSKMDEHIFEEFKGTGNMELRLDRRLAERRIFPAIDVDASSTRHEELLFERYQLPHVWTLRRVLHALDADRNDRDGPSGKGLELLLEKLKHTKHNDEFLSEIGKNANG